MEIHSTITPTVMEIIFGRNVCGAELGKVRKQKKYSEGTALTFLLAFANLTAYRVVDFRF